MPHNWKFFNYITSAILCLVAVLTIFCTWSPLYSTINITPQYNGFIEQPTRAVGINYPISLLIWLGAFFVIFLFIFFILAKKRKASSRLFWINGILASIIGSHIFLWLFLAQAITTGGDYMAVPPVPWYHIFGEIIVIFNMLLLLVIIIGVIFSFIAIWRIMKAHEDLALTVKEISAQLKKTTTFSEQEKEEHKEEL